MSAAGWSVIRWARNVPTVHRRDGRPDHVAHLVLLTLATYADRDGRARPSLSTLADDARLTDRATDDALGRLREAGLISPAGTLNGGVIVWALNLNAARAVDELEAAHQRRVVSREQAAARAAKSRANRAERHAVVERDVTPHDSVTKASVTLHDGARHAVTQRTSRSMTAHVTLSPPLQPQVTPATTAIELPDELPDELPPDADASGVRAPAREPTPKPAAPNAAYTPEFEAFWAAYGRKGAKKAAAIEWHRAIQRADLAVIMAKVGPYVASTPELRYRKDAERWLKNDGWESEFAPARPTAGGHQPYRNPTDQSVYDEPLLRGS